MIDKNIAYQVGYCDQYHFSKLFKKKTGHSPVDFKKQDKIDPCDSNAQRIHAIKLTPKYQELADKMSHQPERYKHFLTEILFLKQNKC